jgi:hypothetical protein
MVRPLGLAAPIAGLAVGVLAVALWVAAIPVRWLDVWSALGLVAGVGLGVAAYLRGADPRTRRLAVLAIGWNAFGLVAVAIAYAAG